MQRLQQNEQLQSWVGPRPQQAKATVAVTAYRSRPEARPFRSRPRGQRSARRKCARKDENEDDQLDPKLLLIKQAIESLTGQEIKLVNLQDFALDAQHSVSASQSASQQIQAGYGMEYSYQASYTKPNRWIFRQRHGKKLPMAANCSSIWRFRWNAVFVPDQPADPDRQRNTAEKDPLVLNVNAPAAQLTDQNRF